MTVVILERLGIGYLVGGSLASSIYGELRSTNDVDFVADLRADHIAPLSAALRDDFYVSEAAMRDVLRFGTSFNAIHFGMGFKVDVALGVTDLLERARREAGGE